MSTQGERSTTFVRRELTCGFVTRGSLMGMLHSGYFPQRSITIMVIDEVQACPLIQVDPVIIHSLKAFASIQWLLD